MGDIAQAMLRDALDAYVKRDSELATKVLNEDDRLDSLKAQVFRDLLAHAPEPEHGRAVTRPDPRSRAISSGLAIMRTNIAEDDLHGVGARRASPSGEQLTRTAFKGLQPNRPEARSPVACSPSYDSSDGRGSAVRPVPRPSRNRRWRPFCSERCRNEDLARWADGRYRVARTRPDTRHETDADPD